MEAWMGSSGRALAAGRAPIAAAAVTACMVAVGERVEMERAAPGDEDGASCEDGSETDASAKGASSTMMGCSGVAGAVMFAEKRCGCTSNAVRQW